MAKTSSTSSTRTFPNTQTGRNQAYQQAVKQGERSITFKIPASTPGGSSTKKK